MSADKQQEYHAAPDHPLWDILEIHARGYAVPWDGDKWLRYYRGKDAPTHNAEHETYSDGETRYCQDCDYFEEPE